MQAGCVGARAHCVSCLLSMQFDGMFLGGCSCCYRIVWEVIHCIGLFIFVLLYLLLLVVRSDMFFWNFYVWKVGTNQKINVLLTRKQRWCFDICSFSSR